jgi:hypothetical protein
MNIMTGNFRAASLAASLAAVLAAPSIAGIQNRIENSDHGTAPATGNSAYLHYVDFSAASTVAGHSNFSTMTPIQGGDPVKYITYTTFVASAGPSRCYILSTSNPHDFAPVFPNADTRILIKNNAGTWVNLSDDSQFGGTYSWAQLWLQAGGNTRSNPRIRVSAYNYLHNSEAFMLESTWLTDDFSACIDGIPALAGTQNQPAATIDGGGGVYVYRTR